MTPVGRAAPGGTYQLRRCTTCGRENVRRGPVKAELTCLGCGGSAFRLLVLVPMVPPPGHYWLREEATK